MTKTIKIGTRSSELAMYQANLVSSILMRNGYKTEIITIDSEGDINLIQPIYKVGFSGVFTKTLDIALLNNKIDIAVHSLKDVPTNLPENIKNLAVLKREVATDILKYKGDIINFDDTLTVGTGSIRRKAQWLNKYPHHHVEGLRGNVNTRLKKINENEHWFGAIFAKAGLKRINLLGENYINLDWMIPAPAQGAIVVASRIDDTYIDEIRPFLNDIDSEITTSVERDFMNGIQAGCSSPIGAIATINENKLYFKGLIISIDGKNKQLIKREIPLEKVDGFGAHCADETIYLYGDLVRKIKLDLSKL